MGISKSKISPVYLTIATWEWSRTLAIIKAYNDEEHDFGIDLGVISSLTALDIEDSKLLMKSLAKSDTGVINAVTMLISIICISDSNRTDMLELRLETLFDLVDFSSSGHLNLDELTLLFFCIGSALSAILEQQKSCPNENLIAKLVHLLREDLRKDPAAHISKSEFITWSTDLILSTMPSEEVTLQNIYHKIFLSPFRGGGGGGKQSAEMENFGKDDDGLVDESSYHPTVSTPLDSLHPDFKDDETIATRDDEM